MVRKSKKRDNIYENFLLSLDFIKDIKRYILFSTLLFLTVSLIGFLFPIFFVEEIAKYIGGLLKETADLNLFQLIAFIMNNNIQSSFFGIIFGIFLGVIPIMIIISNAYVLGFVANNVVNAAGILILWRLFPHGIFELPAIIIAVSLGIKIGVSLIHNCIIHYYKKVRIIEIYLLILLSMVFFVIAFPITFVLTLMNKGLRNIFFDNLKDSFRVFIFVIVPLLVIAGLIEGSLIIFLR